jgi:hypothetical protein
MLLNHTKRSFRMSRRVVVRLEISPKAKEALERVSDEHGMTQVSVSSRLVEWFAARESMLQGAVLGHYPSEIEADVAALILKHLPQRRSA